MGREDITVRLRATEPDKQSIAGWTVRVNPDGEDAALEIERLRYVLAGVRGAIQTGRNEPLVIWKEQIDIALGVESGEG